MIRILTLCLLFFAYSCSRDKETTHSETRTDLLINKKWNLVSVTGKRSDGSTIPMNPLSTQPYDQDNYYLYQKNGTYTFNDGELKTPGITRDFIDEGTWTFKENEQRLLMVSKTPGTDWYFTILELTSEDFRYDFPLGDATYTYHYHVIQ